MENNNDQRKSKCDKKKKRNVYRNRRGYNLNGSKKLNEKICSRNESS